MEADDGRDLISDRLSGLILSLIEESGYPILSTLLSLSIRRVLLLAERDY